MTQLVSAEESKSHKQGEMAQSVSVPDARARDLIALDHELLAQAEGRIAWFDRPADLPEEIVGGT
ncbi:MAG: hypothetical protein ACE15F_15620 [bacterium]